LPAAPDGVQAAEIRRHHRRRRRRRPGFQNLQMLCSLFLVLRSAACQRFLEVPVSNGVGKLR